MGYQVWVEEWVLGLGGGWWSGYWVWVVGGEVGTGSRWVPGSGGMGTRFSWDRYQIHRFQSLLLVTDWSADVTL